MKIPFKPSMMQIRRSPIKWIILHHTSEIYENPGSKIDNAKFQIPGISKGVLELKQGDINYHYVIDKIEEDYYPILCRPYVYLCEWPDIHDDINKKSIHIALMGSYDFKIPEKRCYEVLAYRLLNPMMKLFSLNPSKIKFHKDVSDDKDISCPGDFVDPLVIESMVRKFVLK